MLPQQLSDSALPGLAVPHFEKYFHASTILNDFFLHLSSSQY